MGLFKPGVHGLNYVPVIDSGTLARTATPSPGIGNTVDDYSRKSIARKVAKDMGDHAQKARKDKKKALSNQRQRTASVKRRYARHANNLISRNRLVVKVLFFNDEERFLGSIGRNIHFRHKLKHRSDDGSVARGLILDSDPERSFQKLYKTLLARENVIQGSLVEFYARIWRIDSRIPSERRAAMITFYPVEHFDFAPEDTYIETPEEVSKQSIQAAKHLVGKFHGERRRRIEQYVKLAESLPFHQREKLWIYHPNALRVFSWLPTKEKDVIAADIEKGKLPEGPVRKTAHNWRKYPFRKFREEYTRFRGLRATKEQMEICVLGSLEGIDLDIKQGIRNLRAPGDASGAGGEDARSKASLKFKLHIANDLMKSKKHLYYIFNKYTASRKGIFEF